MSPNLHDLWIEIVKKFTVESEKNDPSVVPASDPEVLEKNLMLTDTERQEKKFVKEILNLSQKPDEREPSSLLPSKPLPKSKR